MKVGADGKLSIVGELATTSGQFVGTLDAGAIDRSVARNEYRLVDGTLAYHWLACDVAPLPSGNRCSPSELESGEVVDLVQPSAYEQLGGASPWPPVRGVYLVHMCTACDFDQILGRFETLG